MSRASPELSVGSSHDADTSLSIADNPNEHPSEPADTHAPGPRASPPPGFRPALTRGSSSMSSVASMAGPDLPVRFSTWSIASNRDSKDPFSQGESAGGTSGEGLSDAQCTLTSASFRQRMDSNRSSTASAPPGARPPGSRRPPRVTSMYGDVDVDRDETDDRPRRDAAHDRPRHHIEASGCHVHCGSRVAVGWLGRVHIGGVPPSPPRSGSYPAHSCKCLNA